MYIAMDIYNICRPSFSKNYHNVSLTVLFSNDLGQEVRRFILLPLAKSNRPGLRPLALLASFPSLRLPESKWEVEGRLL